MISSKKYDVCIMGAGLGGLICALVLSREGKRVVLLEKNEQLGGALQVFKRNGLKHDTGVHYMGGLGKGESLYKIFKYLNIYDRLQLQQLNENGFDIIRFKGDENKYPLASGKENFAAQLLRFFPKEKIAIEAYVQAIEEVAESMDVYNFKYNENNNFFTKWHQTNTLDYLRSLTDNQKLIEVLLGNNLLYVLEAEKTPFYVHAIIQHAYMQSAWRMLDGGDQIAKLLAREAKKHGCEIVKNAEVDKIASSADEITAAHCKNGKQYVAEHFISNMDPLSLYAKMDDCLVRKATLNRYQEAYPQFAAFTLAIELKPGTLAVQNANNYYFRESVLHAFTATYDENWPKAVLYLTPQEEKNQPFANSISVMTTVNTAVFKPWENSFKMHNTGENREEAYQQFKQKLINQVIDCIEEAIPDIRNNIQAVHASTPLSYRDYLGTQKAALYALRKDYKNPLHTHMGVKTKYKNLLLTGQFVNLHGISGVSISALLTLGEILGLEKILGEVAAGRRGSGSGIGN